MKHIRQLPGLKRREEVFLMQGLCMIEVGSNDY
jgi:hypothetical protein